MAGNRRQTYIESLGVYLPKTETSSKSRVAGIPTLLKIPLQHFTGIESTRRAGADEYSLDLACRAVERCLARSSYGAEEIGLVLAANISKYDREGYVFSIEPNTATVLRRRFGFKNALAFDIGNACAGVFTAIQIADCFLHETNIQAALVVSGEYLSHLSDTAQREITSLSDPRMACLTLGDAGAAVVLARSADCSVGFRDISLTTLGEHSALCIGIPSKEGKGGAIMYADSVGLLNVGCKEGAVHILQSLRENEWNWGMVDHWIPHQVSTWAAEKTAETVMDLAGSRGEAAKLSRKKVITNVAKRGNTATTSHLVALEDQIESGRIRTGERIVFNVVASGMTIGTALYVLDDLPARVHNTLIGEKTKSRGTGPETGVLSVSIASVASTRRRRGEPSATEELCLEAAEACLAKASHGKRDIDVLIFVGVFKKGFMAEPSYAAILAGRLFPKRSLSDNNPAILAFDVHHGPGGFLASCEILRTQFARRQIRAGLVIAAECDNNPAFGEHSDLGVAEVASAALILPPGRGEVELRDCDFYSFEQYADCYRADMNCARQAHVILKVHDDYEVRLRECIRMALEAYAARIGRTLADVDEFHFPQRSQQFLDGLASELGIPRDRIVNATLEGKDLYTSSVGCTLEESLGAGLCGSGKCCLFVSAGPGIQVSCATLYTEPVRTNSKIRL